MYLEKVDAKIEFKDLISYLNSDDLNIKFTDKNIILDFIRYCKEIIFIKIFPNFSISCQMIKMNEELNWICVFESTGSRHISPEHFISYLRTSIRGSNLEDDAWIDRTTKHFDVNTINVFKELGIKFKEDKIC